VYVYVRCMEGGTFRAGDTPVTGMAVAGKCQKEGVNCGESTSAILKEGLWSHDTQEVLKKRRGKTNNLGRGTFKGWISGPSEGGGQGQMMDRLCWIKGSGEGSVNSGKV